MHLAHEDMVPFVRALILNTIGGGGRGCLKDVRITLKEWSCVHYGDSNGKESMCCFGEIMQLW